MIIFKTAKWRNFLSTGNAFTTIQLDAHPTTLILGDNGSGKSTVLDAICFALFSKPYRNINKPQLVNSINNKNCVVELDFTIGKKEYKIVRGIKPAIFEIWVDGMLLNQDAASRDYQKYLEDSILKLNFKSFTQIVILGAASFTPFMQLPAAARREIIEDILDIKIFTAMNVVLKQKMTDLKDTLKTIEMKLKIARSQTDLQQQYIATLQDDRKARLESLDEQIDKALKENTTLQTDIVIEEEVVKARLNLIEDYPAVSSLLQTLLHEFRQLEGLSRKTSKQIEFYHDNDSCPTCKQNLQEDFKHEVIQNHKKELDDMKEVMDGITNKEMRANFRLDEIKEIQQSIADTQKLISEKQAHVQANHRFVQRLELEKADIITKVSNIQAEKQKLRDTAAAALVVANERIELHETQHYFDIANVLLKDSGIKTRIIRQYLPVINKLVNKYLSAMDFFVQFTLDEKFDEVIKSRHRDEFSYESFSEGEKQRIDLALLFTWRTIAKLKNSSSTNLLILDEIFDSSLDNSATEQVMSLLNTLGEGTNVWVISHKNDQLFDKFNNVIKFTKKTNFSICS
jgi:DNA repair exonuclease SbcCD ATPase subunit